MCSPALQHGKAIPLSFPARRYRKSLGMLRREWGNASPAVRRGTEIGSVWNRSADRALVVAWVMPEIVLMFRMAGTVKGFRAQDQPVRGGRASRGSRGLQRFVSGMTIRIRTLIQAKSDARSHGFRRFASVTVG